MFTDTKPDLNWHGDYAVYGVSAGTIYQTPHLLGGEMRGSFLRSGGREHQESLLFGPRIAVRMGRFSPSFSLIGGPANAWRWSPDPHPGLPPPKLQEGFGTEWSAVGGVGMSLHHRINLRLIDVSYSKIYLGFGTLTPVTASAGIIYRIH